MATLMYGSILGASPIQIMVVVHFPVLPVLMLLAAMALNSANIPGAIPIASFPYVA